MSNGTTTRHRVAVFKHSGQVKVWPPYLVVRAGDQVVFSAIGTSATVVFPHSLAFDSDKCEFDTPKIGMEAIFRVGKNSATLMVTQGDLTKAGLTTLRDLPEDLMVTDANDQIYAYSVYCGEVNDHGQGQSSPVMIIEPPEERDPPLP
jgi:hypothetical protein